MPADAERDQAGAKGFDPVRLAITLLQDAQSQDDFAVRHPDAAESALKLRDQMRAFAVKVLAARKR
jgi:hypothetical protein